ncbi:mitochondrial potassium channel-like isoform X2 [Physella acuta]|nr:mitochondrial potassium channel-like isoform X2 [Physella acuta]XP_059173181.1 mitochondrial potassium channel-like isoform X2 [Physella acuta]XP_059173182.1 mitochondrial potassium channel-like isoform X2 [Physella acuta]XP_059173184.1 mitochondrial potassium channel-like isoform X2 [Physella acuta]XP_059173185.1 mitochondrial potassium channel-like isoform X2 [Physella acuta]XP_059173186.1 mitochondrial potassium channel-like isoform X2 [Physella acuta]
MDVYEDVVGLAEVKQAQEKVVNAEQKFLQVQEDRRAMQQELHTIQAEVRTVGAELEKTSRTDTHYIDLVKKEHEILLIEREMNNKLKTLDKAERDFFSLLSAALRESHEKERSRAEKTKYWSIIGSIIGAVIGIVGSTINNVKRMKELRAIVEESAQNTDSYKLLINRLLDNATEEQLNIHPDHLLKDTRKVRGLAFLNPEELKKHTDLILSSVESSSEMIFSQINILKDTISFQTVGGDKTNISCSSNILEGEMLVKDIQEKLDTSIKKNIWISTTVLSGIITIGLSVIVYILRGSD